MGDQRLRCLGSLPQTAGAGFLPASGAGPDGECLLQPSGTLVPAGFSDGGCLPLRLGASIRPGVQMEAGQSRLLGGHPAGRGRGGAPHIGRHAGGGLPLPVRNHLQGRHSLLEVCRATLARDGRYR